MKKHEKVLSTKQFAEQQLKEIKEINAQVKKKTRKLIIVAFLSNLILIIFMFLLIWYLKTQ